jgi:hypothetical protein
MKGSLIVRTLGAGMALAVLGVGMAGGVASASGHGGTEHGTGVFDTVVVTFFPPSAVTLPATGCWMTDTYAFMSVSGNAQGHLFFNKNGGWSTFTFTGTASVQPIVFKTGKPEKTKPTTPTSNTVVTTTASHSLASGHLTIWEGVSSNKNAVTEEATLTFMGNLATGTPVQMSGRFAFTFTHLVYTATGAPTLTNSTLQSAHTTLTCQRPGAGSASSAAPRSGCPPFAFGSAECGGRRHHALTLVQSAPVHIAHVFSGPRARP